MRGKTLLFLLGILVVLGGVAAIIDTTRRHATETTSALLFPGLKTELVDKIRINAEGKETVLEKRGDVWQVASEDGHVAEEKAVKDILDRLPKFYYDQVVSTNPANQSLFKVDSTGIEVWVDQKGKEIAHFYVGKPGPDFASTYVRAASSQRVIQVPEYLPSIFQRGETWREKTIFSLTQQDVNRYEYSSPTRGRLLVTKDASGVWHMEEPDTGVVETSKIGIAVGAFSRLKAAGFADTLSAAAAGIEADSTRVAATLADGTSHVLQVGLPAPSLRHYVRRQGSDQIFTVPAGALNTMMPKTDFLKARPNPQVSGG